MHKAPAFAIALSAILLIGATVGSKNAYAHTFSGDESASFLAAIEVIKVHLSVAENDFATNATMSAEHVGHAAEHLTDDMIEEITERNSRLGTELPASLEELRGSIEGGNATADDVSEQIISIDNLLEEALAVRIEKEQLTNSTVQGTMLANLVDEILESYEGAYGVGGEDHDSMQMDDVILDEDSAESQMDSSMHNDTESESHHTIVSIMDYESAQALAARAVELFDTKLKVLAVANATEAVTALDDGLDELKQAIDDKAPLDEVTVIVHNDVHQNIQSAYNLQVIPEFPLPLLAVMIAIAGAIGVSRIKGLGANRLP